MWLDERICGEWFTDGDAMRTLAVLYERRLAVSCTADRLVRDRVFA
jgi:hypothetical protein